MPLVTKDIGILASRDPVAIDKAAIDLVEKTGGKALSELAGKAGLNPLCQIEHAEKIGLGTGKYRLIEI